MLFRSAYVLDRDDVFDRRCNREMVDLEPLIDADDLTFLRVAIMKHVTLTNSRFAETILADWDTLHKKFVKVMPRDYKRALAAEARRLAEDAASEAAAAVAPAAKKSGRGRQKAVVHG